MMVNQVPDVGSTSDGNVTITIHGERYVMPAYKARVLAEYLNQKADQAEEYND